MEALERDGTFTGAPVDLGRRRISIFPHRPSWTRPSPSILPGRIDLHVATVDLPVLGDAVKWEASRGGQLFPHIYAALPLSAVLAYGPLERDHDGKVKLPVAG